jgi:enoyl-CoA hydratase
VPIRLETIGSVAVVTIDEPATRNALTGASSRELLDCLEQVSQDQAVAAAVLRGAGGHFCAGADRTLLAAARQHPYDPGIIADLEAVYECFARLGNMPVPTVAAIRGAAVGAGMNLALAADVRIAARDARLLSGFLRIGLHPGGGHFTMLDRLGGPQTTVAMALFGEEISGSRLAQLGLAWEVVDDAEVEGRAIELASRVTDVVLAREAMATFRAQAQSRQLPAATAARAEQAAQLMSFARTSTVEGAS